ncbi:MAG: hypothetical protein EB059_11085, partial [Alphaproteobacteria bacterium]|nr:hypothetical protein [Alphaproteobacteria bacterium]
MNNSKKIIIHRDLRSARLRGSRSVAALLLLSCSFVGTATARVPSVVQAQKYANVVFVPSADQPLLYAGAALAPAAGSEPQMVIRAHVGTDATTGKPAVSVAPIGGDLAAG